MLLRNDIEVNCLIDFFQPINLFDEWKWFEQLIEVGYSFRYCFHFHSLFLFMNHSFSIQFGNEVKKENWIERMIDDYSEEVNEN